MWAVLCTEQFAQQAKGQQQNQRSAQTEQWPDNGQSVTLSARLA